MSAAPFNEKAIEAAADLLDGSGLTHPQMGPPAVAVATDLVAAVVASMEAQGFRLVAVPLNREELVEKVAGAAVRRASSGLWTRPSQNAASNQPFTRRTLWRLPVPSSPPWVWMPRKRMDDDRYHGLGASL